jgi:ABC-type transport system involved in cytochrome c biogenesis ATPase subunit
MDPRFAAEPRGPFSCPSNPVLPLVVETTVRRPGPVIPIEPAVRPWATELSYRQVCIDVNAAAGARGPAQCLTATSGHLDDCRAPVPGHPYWTAACGARGGQTRSAQSVGHAVTPETAPRVDGGPGTIGAPSILDGSRGGPALVVEHLSKRFGDRVAFDDVSFEVGYGEVFGFLGPNGAGKTTTVRTLGTLLAPSSGTATVAGIPLTAKDGPAIRSRISIMPESPGLYLRLSVMENLQCFAALYRLDDRPGRIVRALRAVNLADRADDPCGALSKGLRQRVALARACSTTRPCSSSTNRPPASIPWRPARCTS